MKTAMDLTITTLENFGNNKADSTCIVTVTSKSNTGILLLILNTKI